jgi:hypothetical protein
MGLTKKPRHRRQGSRLRLLGGHGDARGRTSIKDGDAHAGAQAGKPHSDGEAGHRDVGSQAPTDFLRSASAGVGRSQKAILRARIGRAFYPDKDGDLRTDTQATASR